MNCAVSSCRSTRLTVSASQQGGPVPRRLRQNSRLAPALFAGLAAAQLGLLPAPVHALAELQQPLQQQPQQQHEQASAAIDFLSSAGDVALLLRGLDLPTLQDKMGGVALAFDTFPASLLTPERPLAARMIERNASRTDRYNQHGFCYSRLLCASSTSYAPAVEPAEGA